MLLRVALMLLAIVLTATGRAHAHAVLLESTPPDGAVLKSAPDQVALRFNEAARSASLNLIDESGRVTPLRPSPQGAPEQVAAPLPPLAPGSYVVSWRLVSIDGHPVGGSTLFTIGTAGRAVDITMMVRAAEPPAWLLVAHQVARAVTYAGALLAAGLALTFSSCSGGMWPLIAGA